MERCLIFGSTYGILTIFGSTYALIILGVKCSPNPISAPENPAQNRRSIFP
jgi:hypothetical protein